MEPTCGLCQTRRELCIEKRGGWVTSTLARMKGERPDELVEDAMPGRCWLCHVSAPSDDEVVQGVLDVAEAEGLLPVAHASAGLSNAQIALLAACSELGTRNATPSDVTEAADVFVAWLDEQDL